MHVEQGRAGQHRGRREPVARLVVVAQQRRLHEPHRLGRGRIGLGVLDATTGDLHGHSAGVATTCDAPVLSSCRSAPVQHPRHDRHAAMGVPVEAATGIDNVLVDADQRSERHVVPVVVRTG